MYIYIYACGAVIINGLWTLEKKRSKKGYRFGTSIFDRNWYSFHSPWTVRGTFYHTGPKKTDTARRILNIPFPTGCRMRFYLVPQQPLVYDKVSHYIKLPHTFFISH